MVQTKKSMHAKLSLVILATTVSALLITGAAMVVYDLRTYSERTADDLVAQADILGLATAPALEFEDPPSAEEYLSLLAAKPSILSAAIYTAKGARFATYKNPAAPESEFPALPALDGYTIANGQIELFKRIVSEGEILGSVYMKAQHEGERRLWNYLAIMSGVMALSLLGAGLLSRRLQRNVTRPIMDITATARDVMERRDFGSRAPKTTDDEIGVLADAFNAMLGEIEHEISERKRAEEALQTSEARLRQLNAELEERVVSRTAQLEAANKDLEGFSYSVSHDLRAPIRAISGFCSLLVEDHRADLNDEAKRKLGIIAAEAARMGNLIDDLLAFSRLGRKALEPTELDMNELVRDVFARLTRTGTERSVDLRVGSMPRARGDRNLIEQVWVNLLANAIKFSSKKDAPAIEVGGISDEREHVYYVRDNGAGFDPRYQDKLFGVFQRLHHDSEFPGTGVGLALVHRIVSRHQGRVWAEGQPGEGATFHFTLPKEPNGGRV